MENVYEQFFVLKYHGGWSFAEAYNLPIKLREWFLARLLKQKKDESDAIEESDAKQRGGETQLGPGVKVPKL